MKKTIWLAAFLAASVTLAQRGGGSQPLKNYAETCTIYGTVAQDTNCSGYEKSWCVNYTTNIVYACDPTTHVWDAVGSGGGGSGTSDFDTILAGTLQAGSYLVGNGATLSYAGTGVLTANYLTCTDCVTLGSETSGSYAAGDSEGGNATGLSCTACVAPASEISSAPSSAWAGIVSDETGSGAWVFGTSPTISTPTISGFTASRCARFNGSGVLVASTTGDCDSGDTGGGSTDSVLISGTAVTDGNGVNFIGGNGVDFTFDNSVTPDTATLSTDNTEVNDTTWGDGSVASIDVTYNASSGIDPTLSMGSSKITTNVPIEVSDQTSEPGNGISVFDNDTAFTNDPTCSNSGVAGQFTFLDSDESATDVWDACDGASLKWRFPAASTTTTQALFATATSGAGAYRAIATTDLPATGTWTFNGAIDAGGGSVEVGNGTGPTVDAAGEVAVDTTANQFLLYSGSAVRVLDPRYTIQTMIANPSSSDDPFLFKAPYGMTITNVACITAGSLISESVDVQECSSTGASCATVDAVITCDADGAADDGSLSNPSIDAADWIKLDLGTPTGTGYLTVVVIYQIVRE